MAATISFELLIVAARNARCNLVGANARSFDLYFNGSLTD